jgi:flagellar biosynthetic protein FliQ
MMFPLVDVPKVDPLSFIPKLAVMTLALLLFGEWQLAILIDYFEIVFERIQTMAY